MWRASSLPPRKRAAKSCTTFGFATSRTICIQGQPGAEHRLRIRYPVLQHVPATHSMLACRFRRCNTTFVHTQGLMRGHLLVI